MALPGKTKGYFEETGPEGSVRGETFTCCHCNGLEVAVPGKTLVCEHCWAPVCDRAACRECVPFEKKLELFEKAMARTASRNSLFEAAGIK